MGVPFDESTVGILSVLVFGAGTDYALLLISRYRDELKQHEDRYVAMGLAWRRTAEAVLSSAATVVVGVLVLLLTSFPTTRGLGVASAIGIVVAAVVGAGGAAGRAGAVRAVGVLAAGAAGGPAGAGRRRVAVGTDRRRGRPGSRWC